MTPSPGARFPLDAILVLLSAILVVAAPAAAGEPAASITRDELAAHIRFLASDALEGRGVGTPGDATTQAYLETMFRLDGLAPAFGDRYVQDVTLRRVVVDPAVSLEFAGGAGPSLTCRHGDDFVVTFPEARPEHDITADLVYVGFGISAPPWTWDDFKQADVRGKVLLFRAGEPGGDQPELFEGKALTYYGRWTYKLEEAARRGAAGVLLIHTPKDAAYGWEVVRNSWSGPSFFDPDRKDLLAVQGWITEQTAARLLARAGLDLTTLQASAEGRAFRPVSLAAKVHVKARNTYDTVTTRNVAGVVRGRLPRDAAPAIVISAHHDHFGRGVAEAGDAIYNGAIDNAAALAVLLGLARVLGPQVGRFDSDVIFLCTAAEEEGFLGAERFVHHPPVPTSRMIADLNLEMVGVWDEADDIVGDGAQYSDLGDVMAAVARRRGVTVSPAPAPEQGLFYRSDQLSFARVGVPGVKIDIGNKLHGKPSGAGERLRAEYRAKRYHRPSDEFDPTWPLAGTVQLSGIVLDMVVDLDKRGLALAWKPGAPYHR